MNYELGAILLLMRKLSHRDVESFAQGHTALKWQNSVPEFMLLSEERMPGIVIIVLHQITMGLCGSFNLRGGRERRIRKDTKSYNAESFPWARH